MSHTITLIPGDGIGPEVTEAVLRILHVAGVAIDWDRQEAGIVAFERHKTALPVELLDSVRRTRVALKGPVTTPIGEGFTSVNVGLRKALDLFVNLRPVWSLPGVPTRYTEHRPDHRPREHRGPVFRSRARSRAGRRREPEDHHREGIAPHQRVRVRARPPPGPQEGDGRPQGQHHEAQRRAVHPHVARRRPARTPTSPTRRRSSTPPACCW